MSDNEWTTGRIAELRRLAQEAKREDAECEHLGAATVAFCCATDADAYLSLLDALESARAERDALKAENEDCKARLGSICQRACSALEAKEVPR